jgi:hypothetical protein
MWLFVFAGYELALESIILLLLYLDELKSLSVVVLAMHLVAARTTIAAVGCEKPRSAKNHLIPSVFMFWVGPVGLVLRSRTWEYTQEYSRDSAAAALRTVDSTAADMLSFPSGIYSCSRHRFTADRIHIGIVASVAVIVLDSLKSARHFLLITEGQSVGMKSGIQQSHVPEVEGPGGLLDCWAGLPAASCD